MMTTKTEREKALEVLEAWEAAMDSAWAEWEAAKAELLAETMQRLTNEEAKAKEKAREAQEAWAAWAALEKAWEAREEGTAKAEELEEARAAWKGALEAAREARAAQESTRGEWKALEAKAWEAWTGALEAARAARAAREARQRLEESKAAE